MIRYLSNFDYSQTIQYPDNSSLSLDRNFVIIEVAFYCGIDKIIEVIATKFNSDVNIVVD